MRFEKVYSYYSITHLLVVIVRACVQKSTHCVHLFYDHCFMEDSIDMFSQAWQNQPMVSGVGEDILRCYTNVTKTSLCSQHTPIADRNSDIIETNERKIHSHRSISCLD